MRIIIYLSSVYYGSVRVWFRFIHNDISREFPQTTTLASTVAQAQCCFKTFPTDQPLSLIKKQWRQRRLQRAERAPEDHRPAKRAPVPRSDGKKTEGLLPNFGRARKRCLSWRQFGCGSGNIIRRSAAHEAPVEWGRAHHTIATRSGTRACLQFIRYYKLLCEWIESEQWCRCCLVPGWHFIQQVLLLC